jgi:hypothetical protein
VFTVINYLLDEDAILQLAGNVYACLDPEGSFLFDLAMTGLFHSAHYQTHTMTRAIEISPLGGDRHRYTEHCEGVCDETPFEYTDAFTIRQWNPGVVIPLLATEGLHLVEDHTRELAGSGSHYLRVGRQP